MKKIFISISLLCIIVGISSNLSAQDTTQTVLAKSGSLSFGVIGGVPFSIAKEAIEGYSDTEFKSGGIYGGNIMYRFPSGYALELCSKRISMDLKEKGENFGILNMMPVMFLIKFQDMPENETGLTAHAGIGCGINFTSFDKGPFLIDLENIFGIQYIVDVDNSFVFEAGGGLDYFFNKNLSISLDGQCLLTNVGTHFVAWGQGGTQELEDVDKFFASNINILLGLRCWF